MTVRLNKYLASCGVGSRRKVEQLITAGRVTMNGYLVSDLGHQVEDGDAVAVDDVEVHVEAKTYIVIRKPRGYICAVTNPDYPVVLDLLPRSYDRLRLFPVGRLDLQSEGILILTNDGDFANDLIHPSNGVTKTYEVRMNRVLTAADLENLRGGTVFEGRRLVPLSVDLLPDRRPEGQWATFVLGEGVKREIRLMAEGCGMTVEVLFRRAIGRMELRTLKSGEFVEVTLKDLWKMIRQGGRV